MTMGKYEGAVYDHLYFGNVCSGFGGEVKCRWPRCGKPPDLHRMGAHSKPTPPAVIRQDDFEEDLATRMGHPGGHYS